MKKPKAVLPIAGILLLALSALLFGMMIVRASTRPTVNISTNGNPLAVTQTAQGQSTNTTLEPPIRPIIAAQPVRHVVPKPTTSSTTKNTAPTSSPTTGTGQGNVPPILASSGSDRYYPAGTSVATMMAGAANLTKQQVKLLIESQVSANFAAIQNKLGITTLAKADALFLGMASRESTLNASLETGSGPSHSYGALQAAESAYNNSNYPPETDVPDVVAYDFTPGNFYDPGIAIHMGIRHLLHFAVRARAANFSGNELLRHALIGYNTGSVMSSNQSWLQQYSDEIGSIAGWYLNNGHLYDTAFTWTGSSAVNRSSPWGWYP